MYLANLERVSIKLFCKHESLGQDGLVVVSVLNHRRSLRVSQHLSDLPLKGHHHLRHLFLVPDGAQSLIILTLNIENLRSLLFPFFSVSDSSSSSLINCYFMLHMRHRCVFTWTLIIIPSLIFSILLHFHVNVAQSPAFSRCVKHHWTKLRLINSKSSRSLNHCLTNVLVIND